MKATLIFNLPEEREEYQLAMDGAKNKAIVDEIWEQIFRPAFKHGYNGLYAAELNTIMNTTESSDTIRVIRILSDIYLDIVRNDK